MAQGDGGPAPTNQRRLHAPPSDVDRLLRDPPPNQPRTLTFIEPRFQRSAPSRSLKDEGTASSLSVPAASRWCLMPLQGGKHSGRSQGTWRGTKGSPGGGRAIRPHVTSCVPPCYLLVAKSWGCYLCGTPSATLSFVGPIRSPTRSPSGPQADSIMSAGL